MAEKFPDVDYDTEFPYILFDYYMDAFGAGEIPTREDAIRLYLEDIAMADVEVSGGNDV